jgi:hypothetical protein
LQQINDAYFIAVSNYFEPPAAALVNQFDWIFPPVTITLYREGVGRQEFFYLQTLGGMKNLFSNKS